MVGRGLGESVIEVSGGGFIWFNGSLGNGWCLVGLLGLTGLTGLPPLDDISDFLVQEGYLDTVVGLVGVVGV